MKNIIISLFIMITDLALIFIWPFVLGLQLILPFSLWFVPFDAIMACGILLAFLPQKYWNYKFLYRGDYKIYSKWGILFFGVVIIVRYKDISKQALYNLFN